MVEAFSMIISSKHIIMLKTRNLISENCHDMKTLMSILTLLIESEMHQNKGIILNVKKMNNSKYNLHHSIFSLKFYLLRLYTIPIKGDNIIKL